MKKVLKWAGYTVGGLIVVVCVAVATIYGLSESRFRQTYVIAEEKVDVADDSATLARGRHIATAIAKCVDCHGDALQGTAMINEPPMGRLVALNLTRGDGGIGAELSPAAIERAVRHGVGRNGRALRIMPSEEFQYLSDEDLRAVVSYVSHAAPVNNVLEPSRLMFLPRALMVFGAMPLLAAEGLAKSAAKPSTIAPAATPEYGAYLATVGGCTGCHGPGLSGGKIPAGDPKWPPAANLTRSGNLGRWTEAQFTQTLRTGARPDGSKLNDAMPWKLAGQMTDSEIHAVFTYLQSVPARDYGNR